MSVQPATDHGADRAITKPATPQRKTVEQRLTELKRAFQRQLRRKPTEFERTLLDRAALMSVRAEYAASDPRATSEDVVRLDNAARRARADFERICAIPQKNRPAMTLGAVLRGGRG
jgi:hypothetical protein